MISMGTTNILIYLLLHLVIFVQSDTFLNALSYIATEDVLHDPGYFAGDSSNSIATKVPCSIAILLLLAFVYVP